MKQQQSIWTALSRQQRRAAAATKRLAVTSGGGDSNDDSNDDGDSNDSSSSSGGGVARKKRRTAPAANAPDAGTVTDGELFSSQEDATDHPDSHALLSQAPAGDSRPATGASARGCWRADTRGRASASLSARDDDVAVDELEVQLSQHLVTPEKPVARAKQMAVEATRAFSPKTARTPLHEKKAIKDNVHGLIEFEPLCMRIIDTLQFQRLRHLHQLGAANLVYIGATHSRFEHCLGVAFLAEKMVESIRFHQPWLRISDSDVLCVKLAGLCHDLGHGPFSHVFDGIFIKALKKHRLVDESFAWTHEKGSLDMLDHLLAANRIDVGAYGLSARDLTFVKELIYGGPLPGSGDTLRGRPAPDQRFLYDFVNNAQSGLDVDKLDYFLRDATHAGVKASCDSDLLIQNARVLLDRESQKLSVCFPEKLACQVMRAFHTRFELHQSVYQHKTVRAIEYMICDVFLAAHDHLQIKRTRVSDIVSSMEAYQHLDDRVLARVQESDGPELADARRILNRIATKPYYDYVGKTLVTDHSRHKSEEMLTNEILSCSSRRSLAHDKRDVIVEFMRIHFGKGEQDPLQHVRFYSKNASAGGVCYRIPAEAYEMHGPKTFQEHSIRVFVKQPRLLAPVREAFEAWGCKFNGSHVFPLAVDDCRSSS